jgi:histidyl-tRNA synthetase
MRGVAFVAVLGDEERARGNVALKNMRTGEQIEIPQNDLAGWLLKVMEGGKGRVQ